MFTRNSTTPQHRVSVQTAESILPLCCMQMTCLVEKKKKVLSICIHVHFTLETLVSSAWPCCILDLGCFSVDACTAICLKKPLAGGPLKEK